MFPRRRTRPKRASLTVCPRIPIIRAARGVLTSITAIPPRMRQATTSSTFLPRRVYIPKKAQLLLRTISIHASCRASTTTHPQKPTGTDTGTAAGRHLGTTTAGTAGTTAAGIGTRPGIMAAGAIIVLGATTTRGMHHAMSEVSEPSTEAIRASMLIAEVRQRVYVPLAIVNRQASPAARSATAAVCAPMAAPHVVATSTARRPRLHAAPVASEVYVPQAVSEAAAAAQAPLVVAVAVVREAPSGVAAQVAEAVSADNDWKHNGLT